MFELEILGALGVGYFIGLACAAILFPLFRVAYSNKGKSEVFTDPWRWNPKVAQEFKGWYISNSMFKSNKPK